MASERYTATEVIEALKATKGMVYLAAERLGCSHQTVYNYINRYPTVKAEAENQDGKMGDTTELKLYQAIMRDEAWAIAFYLKTKGKKRGYVERSELTGKDGEAIQYTVKEWRAKQTQNRKQADDAMTLLDEDGDE